MIRGALIEVGIYLVPVIALAILFYFEPKWAFDDEEEEEKLEEKSKNILKYKH